MATEITFLDIIQQDPAEFNESQEERKKNILKNMVMMLLNKLCGDLDIMISDQQNQLIIV